MFRIFFLLILSFSLYAQDDTTINENLESVNKPTYQYVSLKENKVYDIEIIVFAYRNALPNQKTYQNKSIFDDSLALLLNTKPEDLSYVEDLSIDGVISSKLAKDQSPIQPENSDFTIPIDVDENDKQVLVWFELTPEDFQLKPIWERLIKQANIVPLIHRAWRQPETPFDDPTYVKLSNIVIDEEGSSNNINTDAKLINPFTKPPSNIIKNSTLNDSLTVGTDGEFINSNIVPFEETDNLQKKLYSDFTLTGIVALSQGRFMHFGHKLNLFRTYQNEYNEYENMIFSLIERKQLNTDELNYFDSPWFGSIVKITEYTGEKEDEKNNE